ncbi:MAG: transcriptional regulator [Proteobacteria bacterium]|nr:MAG: transcriptional regulator [Pseudomonadota bacterium]
MAAASGVAHAARAMRVSLQAQYAICGVFDLAYNGRGEPVQVRVIGERQRIPTRYLEQIFQRLRRARVVTGKRGPGGGYVLARAASAITLRDVVEAVEGPAPDWIARAPGDAPAPHRPDFLWPLLAERFAAALAETTVDALCRDAARAAVARDDADGGMYYI